MFTATFFIALALSAVVALPGDWARRHSSRDVANALNLANGIALVAIVALAAGLGLAHGLGQMLGLLSGIGTGQQLADRSGQPQMGTRSGVQLTVPFAHQEPKPQIEQTRGRHERSLGGARARRGLTGSFRGHPG